MYTMRWLIVAIMVVTMTGCATLESPVMKGQRLVGAGGLAMQA